MRLEVIARRYHVGLRHNPKEFFSNSFRLEQNGSRLDIVGTPKPHIRAKKNLRVVGVAKPKSRIQEFFELDAIEIGGGKSRFQEFLELGEIEIG